MGSSPSAASIAAASCRLVIARLTPAAPTGWRSAVGGGVTVHRVAHAEHVARRVAGGDLRAYLPAGQTENLGVDVLADHGADPLQQVFFGQLREHRVVGVEHERQHELGVALVTDQGAQPQRRQRSGHHVPAQHSRAVLEKPGQVGPKPDVGGPAQIIGPVNGQTDLGQYQAAGAIGSDHVARPHLTGVSGGAVADHAGDAVGVLVQFDELGLKLDVGAGFTGGGQQHRFEHRLRAVGHRLRAGKEVLGGSVRPAAPGLRPRHLGIGQRRVPEIIGHRRLRNRHLMELLTDPQSPENLHRALIDDVRARRVRG